MSTNDEINKVNKRWKIGPIDKLGITSCTPIAKNLDYLLIYYGYLYSYNNTVPVHHSQTVICRVTSIQYSSTNLADPLENRFFDPQLNASTGDDGTKGNYLRARARARLRLQWQI